MKRSTVLLLGLISASFGSTSMAQEVPLRQPEVRGGTGARPIDHSLHVTYDVAQARVTSVRDGDTHLLGTPPCFDNSEIVFPDDPQYVVAFAGEELQNWGMKNCPGASRLKSFTICYRSEALDVSQGGPGASFSIALQEGARGFGRPGTEIWRGTFTGFPSAGAPAGPTIVYDHLGQPFLTRANEPIVFLTVDFGIDPLPLPDGNIGWSFLQLDGDTGPVLVWAPKTALGTSDAMDLYSPGPPTAASYVGTFNYGGCSRGNFTPCANAWIQLVEIENSEVASSAILEGNGVNRSILRELFPARLGTVWSARIDISDQPPTTTLTLLHISAGALTPFATPFGEILVDPAQRLARALPGEGGYTSPIPADVSLVGFTLYLQGSVHPPSAPLYLTNALRVRVGY